MRVAALIPAYNEEDLLPETVQAVQSIQEVGRIVVINDGSGDNTAGAVPPGVELLNLPRNLGKGAALNRGWKQTRADIYLLLDADLGSTAALGRGLLLPLLSGEADMTVAHFGAQQAFGSGRMGFGLVKTVARWGVRFLTGETVANPLSGQRAVRAGLLEELGGFLEGFGVEIGLTVGALRRGFRVREVDLAMKHRAYGRGWQGLRHRGRQLVHVLRALWQCWQKG